MTMQYRGKINTVIGSRGGYADIDPPQQEGNCLQLVGASIAYDAVGETANAHIGAILSVRSAPRTIWTLPADGIPADAIFATLLPVSLGRGLNDLLKDGLLFGEGYISQFPYVLDKCRLLVYLQDAVAAGADVDVSYEVHFEEVKITNAIQQSLLAKIYS